MKLLVVDDQGAVGAIISRIAQQGGWEAIQTTSPRGLDDIIHKEKVDVLMIDYMFDEDADSNGLTVVEELRAGGINIPVILFTGWPDLVDKERADKLRILRVLAKPLSIVDLRVSLSDAKKQLLNESASPGKV
jgi:DNA-binding NtrC family response regulator